MRRGVGRNVSVSGRVQVAHTGRGRGGQSPQQMNPDNRGLIARFFLDLRRTLRLTLPQAAYYLQVRTEVIEALETGQVEDLPPWPETARLVMTYAAVAGVDGRPVLNAIGGLLSEFQEGASQRQRQQTMGYAAQAGGHFMRAGSMIANGAKWLPKDAMDQMRRRPERALYALSVPLLGVLLVMLHMSIFDMVSRPFGSTVRWVSAYFQEHFAPVHDGFRYVEVDDPRSRRADKLQIGGGSY